MNIYCTDSIKRGENMDLYSMSAAEAVEKLGSETDRGLSSREAEKRLGRDGENLLRGKKKKSLAAEFFEQFKDFTVIVLLIASGVSFATSFLEERGDFADPIMILIIVILNAAVGVIQQRRAEHSLEALKNMSAPTATVIRDGKETIIPASKLVRGDIIEVRAGDLVPADARLITSHSLFAQESALTGESVPCEKDARAAVKKGSEQAEIKNMIFSSTVITAGHARAVVTETGMDTAVGKIAHLLNTEDEPTTPLQIKLAKIGKALGIGALSVCALIFMLSILRGMGVLSAFMLSVSLAVAAIPEGLPAVVTVVLSLGVQRMAKSNAVIRRLPAVETLGAATYICSDKTGTLTQNKMTVTAACSASDEIPLTGDAAKKLFALAALCCDAKHTGKGEVSGEPTEAAIVAAAERSGTDTEKLRRKMPRTDEIPFSSERKMMSVAIKDGDKAITVAKGAPDVLIKHCTDIILNGRKIPMTSALREKILRLNSSLADRALRVIAVAAGDTKNGKPDETGLAFCGLIGMEDPPRKEAYEAVKTCRRAGITPVMITGDHAGTACATAKKLGILSRSGECLTGAQIDKMGENEFAQAVRTCRVYARVTPEHKVRIVKALRAHGEIVAMTGDGGKRRARPQGRRHRLRHGQGRHAGGAERRRHDSDRRQFRNYSQGSRRGPRDIRQHPPRDTLSARLQYRRDTLRLCGDALRNARAASADTAPLYKSRHRLAPRPRARRGDARQPRYAASPARQRQELFCRPHGTRHSPRGNADRRAEPVCVRRGQLAVQKLLRRARAHHGFRRAESLRDSSLVQYALAPLGFQHRHLLEPKAHRLRGSVRRTPADSHDRPAARGAV